jgi:hypothetical protein
MATTHTGDFNIPKMSLFGDRLVHSAKALQNPSVFDAAAGTIVTVLAIVGLSGAAPRTMAALSFIGVGIAFVVEAAGTARRSQAMAPSASPVRAEITASVLTQVFTGVAGFVLGLLALLGVGSFVMLAFASVAFGIALLFGTGAAVQVDTVAANLDPSQTRRVIHEAVVGASGARILLAVESGVLGLLALAGVESVTLLLTAGLSLGVGVLLGAVSLGDRLRSSSSTTLSGGNVSTFQSPGEEVPRPSPRGLKATQMGLGPKW